MKRHLPWTLLALASAPGAQDLVADLNTTFPENPSSSPRSGAEAHGLVYFGASGGDDGEEPWVTDGTPGGTLQLGDLRAGILSSTPRGFLALPNGATVFLAIGDGGNELYVTDGTSAGTSLVKEIGPGAANGALTEPVLFGGEAWFFADDGVHGIELWKSDGTAAGTDLALEFYPGPESSFSVSVLGQLAVVDDTLFAFVKRPSGSGWGLFASDGTPAGTQYVTDVTNSAWDQVEGFAALDGKLFFGAESPTFGNELWVSDGTPAGTLVLDVEPAGSSDPADFLTYDGYVYFAATTTGVGRELFRSDGTVGGTSLFADIETQGFPLFTSSSPDVLGIAGGKLLVAATTFEAGRKLYASDGTLAGSAILQADVTFGIVDVPAVPLAGSLVFATGAGYLGDELWRSDGTSAGTFPITDVNPTGPSFPSELVAFGAQVFFRANDGVHGSEPWITDGTPGGETLLADVAPATTNLSSEPESFVQVGNRAFFTADDGVTGRELYVTDGTGAGTRMVLELGPGDLGFFGVPGLEFDDRLFFLADDGVHGLEPWISDGTEEGTYLLGDLWPGAGASNWGVPESAIVGKELYFTAIDVDHGFELFVTDGTPAGTGLALDLQPGQLSSLPGNLVAFDGDLVFTARDASNQVDFWRFDPDTDTVTSLGNINPNGDDGYFQGRSLTVVPAGLVFAANDGVHGYELWLEDGSGPQLLVDLVPGAEGSDPHDFVTLGDRALFSTGTQFGASKLWATDGTAAGTVELASNESFLRSDWTVCRDVAYVWAVDVVGQDSLFVTDGTPAGTQILLSTTYQSSFNTAMTQVGTSNAIVFQNYEPDVGIETWFSDGTVAGTQRFSDAWPGIQSTNPKFFARAGNRMVFSGWAVGYGREVLGIRLDELGGFVAESYGDGCAGSGGVVPTIGTSSDPSATVPFDVRIGEAAPDSVAIAYYGESSAAVDVGGCTVLVPLTIPPNVLVTDGTGAASVPVVLDPSFAGRSFFVQTFVLDPGAELLGLASATPGLEMVVGP